MHCRNLVSESILAEHCNDPDWTILDCRFDLSDADAGRLSWLQGHIPGSQHADLERDLSGPATATSGRHPLPDPIELAERFSAWGIGPQSQVVVYDESDGSIAARAWWLLRWLGHNDVAVLDGGLMAWRRAGLPLIQDKTGRKPARFEMRLQKNMVVEKDEILERIDRGDVVLDARVAPRYLGDVEPLDKKAGHIPGAHNYPYAANLDRHGQFLAPAELRVYFDAAIEHKPPDHVISMCGSGVTACHNVLAMEIAGLAGARLYAGSWSEWSRDVAQPVAVGPDYD
ncbi:MAG: sulfurtransferase [Gammaproteobacteria bacterium]|nr:sulfurtransferase [Gammaproteobacteria bacterium]